MARLRGTFSKETEVLEETTGGEGQATPPPDQEQEPRRTISGKARLSADINFELFQRLRIHLAKTNSRVNWFVEEMIETHC
jgi:hypothetical protein